MAILDADQTVNQWYYSLNAQQQGPVSEDELRRVLAGGGPDSASTLVWTEGMDHWRPASQVQGLGTKPSAAATPAVPNPHPGNLNPYAAPASGMVTTVVGMVDDLPQVKPANYALFAGLLIGGMIGIFVGFALLFFAEYPQITRDEPVLPMLVLGVSLIVFLAGTALSLIYQYRAWILLQPHTRHSTAGRAIGFQFIPLYNYYWFFVAYWRWAEDWNRLVASNPRHSAAPRAVEGLFMTYAILHVAGLVFGVLATLPALIIYLVIMKTVCEAVNYAALGQRSEP